MVETLELDRKLSELRRSHPGVRVCDGWFEGYRRKVANWERRLGRGATQKERKKPTFVGAVASLLWVFKDDIGRGRRLSSLDRALRAAVTGRGARKVRSEARRLADRMTLLERRRVLLPRMMPLFNQWKAVHVPMSIVLTLVAGIHIFLALRQG
jgi:hypothetical protein